MGSLPKPLIGLLLGTIAFFALWMVALKPSSSSSSSGSQGGAGQYQSAINRAHQAVTTSNQANAKVGAPTATSSAPATKAVPATNPAPATKTKTAPATKPTAKTKANTADKPAQVTTAAQVQTVVNAVRDHKVVAVLFYNPAAADDQSMVKEVRAIPASRGRLVKVSVPVSQLTQFAVVTTKVPVVTSPTLVVVDPKGQATTITGFAGTGEIQQRVDDALAVK
jgi:hypothetical protein